MRRKGSFVRSLVLLSLLIVLVLVPLAAPSVAQTPTPSPTANEGPKGLCTPWHRCLAITAGGVVVLWLLSVGGMYALQRRGFETVEHKQGSPQGVPTAKE